MSNIHKRCLTGIFAVAAVLHLSGAYAQSATQAASASPATSAPERAASSPGSLFEALGGQKNINRFTHDFIVIVLDDERIKAAFDDANIERLEGLLADQFCDLSGGPCVYGGKDMRAAHQGKNITTAQFNALAEDLQIAMEQDGVSNRASNQLIAKLAPMYGAVVEK